MNWGDWVLTKDQNVVQIRGTDGYLVGRVSTYDVHGKFAGYESRRNLTPLDFQHFVTEGEQLVAATVLHEMRRLFAEAVAEAVG